MAVVINGTTGIDKVQDGSIQTADLAAGAVTAAKVADTVNLGRRNLVINGAMEVAQRSTSVSGLTSTGYHTIDRVRVNGSGGTYNQSQQTVAVGGETGLPSQFTNFLRHECTAGNDNHILMMRNENVRKFTGTMKASFYAKGTNPTTPGYLSVKFHQSFGSGGSGDVYTDAQNFTLTSTWQRFEFDIEMPSLTGKTIGTGSYGSILFGQDVSTSTDAWTLDITGIQWEYGDTATPFEHRSYAEELSLCQRYYQFIDSVSTSGQGAGIMFHRYFDSNNTYAVAYKYFVPMRSAPTITYENGIRVHLPTLSVEAGSFAASSISNQTAWLSVTPSSSNNTSAKVAIIDGDGSVTKKVFFEAEL